MVNGLGRDWRFPENVVVGNPVGECRPWVCVKVSWAVNKVWRE